MKNNTDFIQMMLDPNLSKEYIKGIKGDLNRNQSLNNKLNIQKLRKFYKTLNNADLLSYCANKFSCIHRAVRDELRDRCNTPLTQFWPILANIIQNKEANPKYYTELLNIKDFPKYFEDTIQKDVVRTSSNQEMQQKLTNVLTAYVIRNAQIGYCQGFNYIAHYLLLNQRYSEEDAFWFLCHLFETLLPVNYYNHLFGVLSDDEILRQILQKEKPHLMEHFRNLSVETSLFTIQWLVCCFTFHNKLTDTIFDLLLIEGSKAQIKSALVYISLLEDSLMQTNDIGSLIMTIEHFISTFQDRQIFIEEYNKIYVNNKLLQNIRQDISNQVVSTVQSSDTKRVTSLNGFLEDLKKQKCQVTHPICIYELETWSRNKKHMDNLVLRVGLLNKINIENKRQSLKNPERLNIQLIVRQNHICDKDDGFLVRALQHKDTYDIQLIDLGKKIQQTQVPNSPRGRSPFKDLLLTPIKALNNAQNLGQKLRMNPIIYKIDNLPLSSSTFALPVNVRKKTQGWKTQRGRSPEQTKMLLRKMNVYGSPKRKLEMNISNNFINQSTDVSQQYPTTLKECKSIKFIAQLSRNTNLINIDFYPDQQ
ncbi:unnamed protein product (macronuclear) [Paramecium tetraurelia]|uniref:Rab-GAP TBC domain-containing protein n=1 Tax=Paramecium tetraurelia TaxID=5888 RepID=A0CDG4_PARTE|nr:uncharacterized protein GSPATT00007042001 [Paramecium tetraurelia]CAK68831.1 unnamed protein product [Paramecium tetraurelia]|eukprot:XP_001436228.1 hypothetical protein (macronuclear) [Paramecium tetraurelia strain d4-2]